MAGDEAGLQAWVEQQLRRRGVTAPVTLAALAGDASFRRYFRAHAVEDQWIVALAPPATEKNREFVACAGWLRRQGVLAPEVLAADLDRGFLLLEDLGDTQYLSVLAEQRVNALYGDALDTLLHMQQGDLGAFEGWQPPPYDAARLRDEMALFPEWFVGRLLGLSLTPAEQDALEALFARLVASAAEQPQVFVHRDYHSRNLMLGPPGRPAVLDFQDAVVGPLTYDLVSLLKDCYVCWPRGRVQAWALDYRDRAVAAGLLEAVDDARFLRWFDWMGLQRHLKVLGIFARLWLRDGKAGYLKDLPLVVRYTLEAARAYPELQPFADWFGERLLPLIRQQTWAEGEAFP